MNTVFKNLTCLVLCCAVLQGCIGAAFVVGAAAGGSIVYDRRNLMTMKHDMDTTRAITTQIRTEPKFSRKGNIGIATFHSVVLLTGQVPNAEERQLVETIAKNTENVKKVYNELRVSGPSSNLTRSSDSWITTKIKTQMLATKGLHSSQMKVVTESGHVYLMGVVTKAQADLAVDIARKTSGVQKVIKLFDYRRR